MPKKTGYLDSRRIRIVSPFWVDYSPLALSADLFEWKEEFVARPDISEVADAAAWLASLVDAADDNAEVLTIADDAPGGVFLCTTNDAQNDLNALQLNGEQFKLAANKKLWFECRFKVDDVDKVDIYLGLHIADIEPYGAVTDGACFRMDHDGDLDCVTEKDSTETAQDTGVDLADDTYVTVGFYFNGAGQVDFYVDGVLKKSSITNIPDDEALSPGFEVKSSQEAVAHSISIDYIRVAQLR